MRAVLTHTCLAELPNWHAHGFVRSSVLAVVALTPVRVPGTLPLVLFMKLSRAHLTMVRTVVAAIKVRIAIPLVRFTLLILVAVVAAALRCVLAMATVPCISRGMHGERAREIAGERQKEREAHEREG